jgi:hypothetical protein
MNFLMASLATGFWALAAFGQTSASKPKLPFYEWGICPGEGCQYGRWKVRKETVVYDTWKPNRRTIAHLSSGDSVVALTGGVITYKPGVLRISQDDPAHGLKAGDEILTYTYLGEGFSTVWFHGRFYRDFDITGAHGEEGDKIWWAKVKLNSGRAGWVNMNQSDFDGTCSLAAPQ